MVIKVEDAEAWVATGDARARRHRLEAPVLAQGFAWAVRVTDQGQDWPIVWSETAPGIAKVYALAQTGLPLIPDGIRHPATWRLVF